MNNYYQRPIILKQVSPPRALTLGVKAEIEKNFSICPKLLINAEIYGLVLAPKAEKKDTIHFGKANLQPLGPMFLQHLLIS
jgi:hypothetical protein